MKAKKIISLFMSMCLITGSICGCTTENKESSAVTQQPGQDKSALVQAAEPPEGGWTAQEFYENIYLCGNKLSYPLSMKTLGQGFRYDEKNYQKSEEEALVASLMYFGDKYLGAVTFTDCEDITEITQETRINTMTIVIEDCEITDPAPFALNGIQFGASPDEMKVLLGDSCESLYDQVFIYYDRETENEICRLFYNKEKLVSINLICE